jgi:hypothetical protein
MDRRSKGLRMMGVAVALLVVVAALGAWGGAGAGARSTGRRHYCGTTSATPSGPNSPAQVVVGRISCRTGLRVMHEWWKAERAGRRRTRSGFGCRVVTTVERCSRRRAYVELNYGV